ncbi:MAG: signal peptidase II [Ruminococcaceae bacterium]|nr:signal peptidase II [Oscillospiraceae bacterium]
MLYITLVVAVVLLAIDQITKIIVDTNMQLHDSFSVIAFGDTQILNITYERNTGAAFSILEGKQIFLIIITSLIMLGILYLMLSKRVKKTPYLWCMSLILSGGIGNLIDRILRGFVVDFIDLKIINFAVFNVADICAVVGAIGLFIFVMIDEIKDAKKEKEKKKSEMTESKTAE